MTDLQSRQRALQDYEKSVVGKEFVWGLDDCTRWAANWAESVLGRSLNLPSYSSESEARAMIEDAGSLESLWSKHLAIAGIHESFEPRLGDVAVVSWKDLQIGAIASNGGFWTIRTMNSLTHFRPRQIVKAWTI